MSFRVASVMVVLGATAVLPAVASAQRVYHGEVSHVVLDRGESSFDDFDFFVDTSTVTPTQVFPDRGDLDFDWEVGNRVSFGWGDGAEYEIDAEFTILDEWESSVVAELPLALNLDSAAPGLGFNFATTIGRAADIDDGNDANGLERLVQNGGSHSPLVEIAYRSEYKDAEFNFMRLGRRYSFWRGGFGARYIDLDEAMLMSIFGQFNDLGGDDMLPAASLTAAGFAGAGSLESVPGADISSVRLDFASNTSNQLYGTHVVVNMYLIDSKRFSLDVTGKGGVFYNDARGQVIERLREVDTAGPADYVRTWRDEDDDVAYAANGRATFTFKARTNIHLKFGLEANFLGNVALAVDQLDAINPSQDALSSTTFRMRMEDVFMYGGTGGIEVWW